MWNSADCRQSGGIFIEISTAPSTKIRQETTTQGSMNHKPRDRKSPPAGCHSGPLTSVTKLLCDVVCVGVVTHAAGNRATEGSITLRWTCAKRVSQSLDELSLLLYKNVSPTHKVYSILKNFNATSNHQYQWDSPITQYTANPLQI